MKLWRMIFFFFFVDILEAHEIKKNKKQEREPE